MTKVWDRGIMQLAFLAKTDLSTNELYAADFIIIEDELRVVTSDSRHNMQCFTIDCPPPTQGQRQAPAFLPQAEFCVGTRISKYIQLKMSSPFTAVSQNQVQSLVVGSGLDGAVQLLWPAQKDMYTRLHSLHTLLSFKVAHVAGLNPRAFRVLKPPGSLPAKLDHLLIEKLRRSVVDCGLLWKFLDLDTDMQYHVAKQIGTDSDVIVDNLLTIALSTNFSFIP